MWKLPILAVGLTVSSLASEAQNLTFADPLTRSGSKADPAILLQAPGRETRDALTMLRRQTEAGKAITGGGTETPESPGIRGAAEWSAQNDGKAAPVDDQILIRFAPDATPEDIANVIAEYDLRVMEVYEGLGAINAAVDLGDVFRPGQTQAEQLRATIEITNRYVEDDRILAATPNIALGANAGSDGGPPAPLQPQIVTDIDFTAAQTVDWGIDDIKVRALWNDPALFGPRVGVIDVGFAKHEDLVFAGPVGEPKHDHGNHVAGIICANHDDKGIAGVVPQCQIVAKTGGFLPIQSESDNVQSFMLLFSQILLTMNDFVTDRDDVEAFNASLGYNWKANFGIDPSAEDQDLIRASVQNQAIFLFPVLDAAQDRDLLIFSAAGNDSGTDDPRDAIFASPFNWAARTACETLGNCAGVIVEAHDSDGNRASFSNINGDISCPGVDILSAVASDEGSYARMSGTSMASPYCTGGYVMFAMLRPNYSAQESLQCLISSGPPTPHGTPRMDLEAALAQCPART